MEWLSGKKQRALKVSCENGALSWLSTLHGLALHTRAFGGVPCLRYSWFPSNMPSNMSVGNCAWWSIHWAVPFGGFSSVQHNKLRDITAQLHIEVCHRVGTEPTLQPLSQEQLKHKAANREDGDHFDIVSERFWR